MHGPVRARARHGVLAQLVERQVRNLKVRGSIPLCSTKRKALAFLFVFYIIVCNIIPR